MIRIFSSFPLNTDDGSWLSESRLLQASLILELLQLFFALAGQVQRPCLASRDRCDGLDCEFDSTVTNPSAQFIEIFSSLQVREGNTSSSMEAKTLPDCVS